MINLKNKSCHWAIQNLKQMKDTDLFPQPFEFEVIAQSPIDVVDYLSQIDIGRYQWVGGRSVLVPKDMTSFQRAIQLDPIDSLFLAALIHQFGSKIEKTRIPKDEGIVLSYRFNPNKNDFYDSDFGWNKFWETSLEKARKSNWVVSTDIASYYSQIYHPMVKSQLIEVKLPTGVVESIMTLLGKLNQGVPRGMPVGPRSIHLVAECAFHPIDISLLSKGYDYCRYVDDIHIFCENQEKAFTTLFDLANILDKQQRFSLQKHKTRVIPADKFVDIAERMAADVTSSDLEKDITRVLKKYSENPYDDVTMKELTDEELAIFSKENLEKLLNQYLEAIEPNYRRISWLFRRLAQVGVPGAVPLALSRIEDLIPSLASVCKYLLSVQDLPDNEWEDIGSDLLGAIDLPIVQHSEYLTLTLLDMYSRNPSLDHSETILNMYPKTTSMNRRKIVRAATAQGAKYWLREHKDELSASDPWLKRALIAGASVFSKDERESWLASIEQDGTFLDKLVSQWARGGAILDEHSLMYRLVMDLREKMKKAFDNEETRNLCFDMGIEYEDLPGSTRDGKQRELIDCCKDENRIQELVNLCEQRRPNIEWPETAFIQQKVEDDDRPF